MTTALVSDQLELPRVAITEAVGASGRCECVVSIDDATRVLEAVDEIRPDLAVLGSRSGDDLTSLCEEIKSLDSPPRVIVVDHDSDEESRLVAFVEAGADGYLSRFDGAEELFAAIDSVRDGRAYIPAELLGGLLRSLIDERRERNDFVRRYDSLTRREVEVLDALVRGVRAQELATSLFVSVATVRTHIHNLLGKLGVHSQVEAAALARKCGLAPEVESAR